MCFVLPVVCNLYLDNDDLFKKIDFHVFFSPDCKLSCFKILIKINDNILTKFINNNSIPAQQSVHEKINQIQSA